MTDGVVTTEMSEIGFLAFNWIPVVPLLMGSRTWRSKEVLAISLSCDRMTIIPGRCVGSREHILRINDSIADGKVIVP